MPPLPPLHLLLVLAVTATASAILDPTDFLALQAIRKSLADLPGSRFLATWDFTSDPCAFPGVLCVNDRVVSLSLGDPRAGVPGLSGTLHPSLGKLSALAELSLVPGRVSGPLPPTLSSLHSLRFLALSRNLISGPIPPSLSSLRSLLTLDLSSNLISGPVPPPSASLVNLLLSRNRLTGSIPAFASGSLAVLDLSHNALTGPVPALPSSLRFLSLSSNYLSGPLRPFLPGLTRLNHLDLSFNRFSGPLPPAVFSLPLDVLRLQRNALSGWVSPPSEVVVGTVDLSFNMLWGPVSPMLAGVKRLYLDSNRFGGKVPEVFVERLVEGRMELFYVQHNFLTGFSGLTAAARLPQTCAVCLEYNCMVVPVIDACPKRSGAAKSRPAQQCKVWGAAMGGGGHRR